MGSPVPAQLLMFEPVPIEDLGLRHLATISAEERRSTGQVYTPGHLVQFVLDQAAYEPSSAQAATVLDPACGAGAFMCEVVARIAKALSPKAGHWTASRRTRLHTFIESSVFGVDVQARACQLARESVARTVEAVTRHPPPAGFFERNVSQRDFLLDDLPALFPQKFAFVVGNPPYVAATRITPREKERLKERFLTAFGRLDLYTLFMEKAIGLLEIDGTLAFITPDKFLATQASQPLRDLLLSRGHVQSVARFRSHRVFDDAATVPCVTVFRAGNAAVAHEKTDVLECAVDDDRVVTQAMTRVPLRTFGGAPWHLNQQADTRLAERIEGAHPRLEQHSVRVSAGLATGLDGLFVMSTEAAEEIEPELVRPAVRGRDLHRFTITPPGLKILVPYLFPHRGTPQLVELKDFPRARALLKTRREALEKRHCVRVWGKRWYDVHDPVPFDLAAAPKILVPDVAATNRFAFDPGQFCPLHSAYYIIPKNIDPEYLTIVLNSKPIEFLIRLRAPVVKDGFSRYRRQFLLPLPIPAVSARARAKLVRLGGTRDAEALYARIAELFGLNARDMDAIAQSLLNRA